MPHKNLTFATQTPPTMPRSNLAAILSLAAIISIAACSAKPSLPDDAHPTTAGDSPAVNTNTATGSADNTGMSGMGGMKGMTGDADHDFLRMMSDHHKGLIVLVHPTIESTEKLVVKEDARKLDKKQDVEIEKMVAMLDDLYKDSYTPKVAADNQKMADELKGKSGNDYSRTFLQDVIAHHQQAVRMVDDYLPKGKNTAVKAMASKMKTDQTIEIADFKRKLSALK